MGSLEEYLQNIKDKLAGGKKTKDDNVPPPLAGGDLASFTNDVNAAKSDAAAAQQDGWFDGLTPSILPLSQTYIIDDLAIYAAEAVQNKNDGEKQDCLDRLYTIEEKADDAIDEMS